MREAWGYRFRWTDYHQAPKQYNHLKYTCDKLADECVRILNELPPSEDRSEGKGETPLGQSQAKRDSYALFCSHHHKNDKLQQLWDQVNTIPEWVDWDQIARGQDVFYRYGEANLTGLTYQSLLGGTASSRVTEVLARTGGFSIKTVWRRLLETTQFILECTNDLASIRPGGDGFASCLRVRFLHATVRQRILQIASRHPGYYSVEKCGVPVNDLDCIGTIAVFSATVIWQSLPRQGIFLRQQEILDYLALWRLVGYYMGTPTEFFSTPAKAKAIMESLYCYEYAPSATSRLHANNIIWSLENTLPSYASRSYLEANARWLNGDKLADALGLGRPGFYYRMLTAGQCLLLMVTCYTCRSIPPLDRLRIKSFRRTVWSVLKSPDTGLESLTIFEFKYVPKLETDSQNQVAGTLEDKRPKRPKVFVTAERRILITLVFMAVISLIGLWTFGKAVSWTWRMLYPGMGQGVGNGWPHLHFWNRAWTT
ncbi:hypothetical protein CLAIMM_11567 [Cladophialophora immunda]|nr:hypothetical protein CLAIMM_11567 [Cladophialophora immunda]